MMLVSPDFETSSYLQMIPAIVTKWNSQVSFDSWGWVPIDQKRMDHKFFQKKTEQLLTV